jgi:hypothetical protein
VNPFTANLEVLVKSLNAELAIFEAKMTAVLTEVSKRAAAAGVDMAAIIAAVPAPAPAAAAPVASATSA